MALPRLGDRVSINMYSDLGEVGEVIEMQPEGMLVKMPWHSDGEAVYATYMRDAAGCHRYMMTVFPEDQKRPTPEPGLINALH